MPTSILPVEARPGSVAFPDSYADWTPEHHNAIWGGDVRGMLVGIIADASRDAAFMRRLATPAAPPAAVQPPPYPNSLRTPVRERLAGGR